MAELFDETFRMSKDEIVSGLASLGVFLTDLAAGSSSMYCRSRSKSTEDKQIGYFCELTGRMITWPNYEICLCYECKFHAREERE